MTKIEELSLEEDEAKKLAVALEAVANEYDYRPKAKNLALINLASAMAIVYGSRVFAYTARKRMEKEERAAKQQGPNVSPFMRPA